MLDNNQESQVEQLKRQLTWRNGWVGEQVNPQERDASLSWCQGYKDFLSQAKTERECVAWAVDKARAAGFRPLEELTAPGASPGPGSRFFAVYREKAMVLGVLGEQPSVEGWRLVGAHVDAPRLDLKPNPLYEEEGLALFKTHYYGGIKKYHWLAIPLALHGVVISGEGRSVQVVIGEDPHDPVFMITDLLPHLAKEQMTKKLGEAIPGENLNLLAGSLPWTDGQIKEEGQGKDLVKLAVLDYLHRRYGLVEEDFVSAELQAVPAGGARDVGLDRSLIGAYGQDDRVCAYTALQAVIEVSRPRRTAMVLLVDKEETGSQGNTGMDSWLLYQVACQLGQLQGGGALPEVLAALGRSQALSADVNAAVDPNFPEVLEKRNAARLGGGVVITKYTGSRGKGDTNDAHAEFVGVVRRLFNTQKIKWQVGELGKVDLGGGGTIAKFLAHYNLDVLDCGVPVLSMHSPLEITSKLDVFTAFRAYTAFLQG